MWGEVPGWGKNLEICTLRTVNLEESLVLWGAGVPHGPSKPFLPNGLGKYEGSQGSCKAVSLPQFP